MCIQFQQQQDFMFFSIPFIIIKAITFIEFCTSDYKDIHPCDSISLTSNYCLSESWLLSSMFMYNSLIFLKLCIVVEFL